MQYKIGDYVSKSMLGVCRIEDMLHLDMNGVAKETLFYLLAPLDDRQGKLYVPVETADSMLRLCMTEEEAWAFIQKIPEIEAIWIQNEKMREQKYKEAIKSNNPEALVSVIKMTFLRKKERLAQGKKSTSADERYFQLAENLLYTELGTALGKPKQEVCQLIIDYMEKNKK